MYHDVTVRAKRTFSVASDRCDAAAPQYKLSLEEDPLA